jgi:hypothetical protein
MFIINLETFSEIKNVGFQVAILFRYTRMVWTINWDKSNDLNKYTVATTKKGES